MSPLLERHVLGSDYEGRKVPADIRCIEGLSSGIIDEYREGVKKARTGTVFPSAQDHFLYHRTVVPWLKIFDFCPPKSQLRHFWHVLCSSL